MRCVCLLAATCAAAKLTLRAREEPLAEGQHFSLAEVGVEASPGQQTPVELLRYVTPYSEDFETLTDVTHHAPSILGKQKLHLYSMVDTWVGGRPSSFIWLNSTANQCETLTPSPKSDGMNGFELKASLLFFEASEHDGRATQVIPAIAPTPYGQAGSFGELTATEAVLQQHGGIRDEDLPQCPGGACATDPLVYRCTDPSAGHCVHQLRMSFRDQEEQEANLASSFIESTGGRSGRRSLVHRSDLTEARSIVAVVDKAQRQYKVALQPGDTEKSWRVGSKIFIPKRVPSDSDFGSQKIADAELLEAGFVEKIEHASERTFAHIRLAESECVPSPLEEAFASHAWQAAVRLAHPPSSSPSVTEAPAQPVSVLELGMARKQPSEGESAYALERSSHARGASLLETSESAESLAGTKVVLLAPSGPRIATATVDFGAPLAPNERVIGHFVATGHGWEHTDQQCGEFCKVMYRLTVDHAQNSTDGYSFLESGTEAASFSLWRDDCKDNPLNDQAGTWDTDRNGWCPGAVSNGYFADVTSLVEQGGMHKIGVEATVDGHSGMYVNKGGFAYQDPAKLEMSLNFFRVKDGDRAARRGGEGQGSLSSSFGEKERPVSFTEFAQGLRMDEAQTAATTQPTSASHTTPSKRSYSRPGDGKTDDGFLGANAPWFGYDRATRKPDVTVPLFSGTIHQASNRIITAEVPTPNAAQLDPEKNYRIGLHLQLRAPPDPLVVDRWDRYASFGYFVPAGEAIHAA